MAYQNSIPKEYQFRGKSTAFYQVTYEKDLYPECKDVITIKGLPGTVTEKLEVKLEPRECDPNDRKIYFSDNEVFVGNIDTYWAYVSTDHPNDVVGNNKIKTGRSWINDKFVFKMKNKPPSTPSRSGHTDKKERPEYDTMWETKHDDIYQKVQEFVTKLKNDNERAKMKGVYTTLNEQKMTFGGSKPIPFFELDYSYTIEGQNCQENIEIKGNKNTLTKPINFIFKPPCEPEGKGRKRTIYFSNEEVLVGSEEQNIMLYVKSTHPNIVVVVQNGNPEGYEFQWDEKKQEYTKGEIGNKYRKERLVADAKQLGEDFKRGSSKRPGVYLTLGKNQHSEGENALPPYQVDYDREDDGKSCKEKIEIKGRKGSVTEHIDYTMHRVCDPLTTRRIYFAGDEVLVGGANQNTLLYGHVEVPDQLIAKKYEIKKFTNSKQSNLPFEGPEVAEMEEAMKNLRNKVSYFFNNQYFSHQLQELLGDVNTNRTQMLDLLKRVKPVSEEMSAEQEAAFSEQEETFGDQEDASEDHEDSPKVQNSITSVETPNSTPTIETLKPLLESMHSDITNIQSNIQNQDSSSIYQCFEKIGEIIKITQDQIKTLDDQRVLIETLQEKNKRLKKTVRDLSILEDDLEQGSRRKTLEILGVPESTSEEPEPLKKIVVDIGAALGVTLTEDGIDECRRWESGGSGIVVTFSRRRDCIGLLQAKRARPDFSTKNLQGYETDNRIIIRSALTKQRYTLFQIALKKLKPLGYRYLYPDREGRVRAKKDKHSVAIWVKDEEELAALAGVKTSDGKS